MTQDQIYQNIAQRTGGDIYIGVVGPVRSGKSSFIKRFAELMLLPRIKNEAQRARAKDELPQSAAGRTIMTTEPKFIPEKAVSIDLKAGGSFRARLIDCVGYMVDGALGHEENNAPRLVKSPWFDQAVPFDQAAETGTRRVIREHATIGLVVTTDGSVAELPREKYLPAERRIIAELDEIGKPYLILLNCTEPDSEPAHALAAQMEEVYHHPVCPINAVNLTAEQLNNILQKLLYEFPLREIAVSMPSWVTMLEPGHWLQSSVYQALLEWTLPAARCSCGLVLSLISFSRFWARKPTFPSQMKPAFCPVCWSWLKPKRRMTKSKAPWSRFRPLGTALLCPVLRNCTWKSPKSSARAGSMGYGFPPVPPACT